MYKNLFYQTLQTLEAYYENSTVIEKSSVKDILDHLNGGLSFRLQKYSCSSRLLEYCFEFKPEKGPLNIATLRKNVERVIKHNYIDSGMFAEAFANILVRWNCLEHESVLSLLLPTKLSKSFVSVKCFAKINELAVERSSTYNESIKMIRFIFENTLRGVPDEYKIELIEALGRLFDKFPESFTESDFSSFAPLTLANNRIQLKSVELISKVLKDRPIVLTAQVTLIFAQLKGDFLRLKHQDASVLKDAVKGLMKLFAEVLRLSLANYLNYCDHEIVLKIREWTLGQLTRSEETEWIKHEHDIASELLLIASVLSTSPGDSKDISAVVIEFINPGSEYIENILGYFLNLVSRDPDQYKDYFGAIEKCFHELNSCDPVKWPSGRKLVPLMRIIVEEKRSEYNSVAGVCLLAKIIAFHEYSSAYTINRDLDLTELNKDHFKFTQMTEYFAKMFWRSSEQTQDFCMVLWLSSLRGKRTVVPSQILQSCRALLECSEVKAQGSEHQDRLIAQIQDIVKEFMLDDDFLVRLECGIVLGLIAKLFNDSHLINVLFEQSMKHAMAGTSKNQKSRVCYIMGIVTLKSNLENGNDIELNSNALIGLIASWGREHNSESKSSNREISAASISALAYYIEKCGCTLNSEFYRDSCELLLEQVFIKDRCELMVHSVKELAKSLSLFVNLLPCQSQFIAKTIRLLLESRYLRYYDNDCIELMRAISEFNPQISAPSEIIYDQLKKNVVQWTRGSFGLICQYLSLQISFNDRIAFEVIDSGILMILLERSNIPECFEECEHKALAFLVETIMNITILDKFSFWMDQVFEPLNLNGGERRSQRETSPLQEVSNSGFSLADLKDSLKLPISLRPSTVHIILKPLNSNIYKLLDIEPVNLRKFLGFLIKICINISTEKINERKFFLTGIILFRGAVRTLSKVNDAQGVSVLEPFDSQIVSIISSALRCSNEGDPLFAACAFGSLFSFICNRPDLHEGLRAGTGRISGILKKAIAILKDQEIFWSVEIVENLILLSIIIGFCSLKNLGFDYFDEEVKGTLQKNICECFLAYKSGKLERNIRLSLSGQDRLLLVETWLQLSKDNPSSSAEVEGVISVLSELNSEFSEQVCALAMSVFSYKSMNSVSSDFVRPLLRRLYSFGLEQRDPLAVHCLISLMGTEFESLANEFLTRLSIEFLSTRFSDFDAQFGLELLKAQNSFTSNQEHLFGILKSKLQHYISIEIIFL